MQTLIRLIKWLYSDSLEVIAFLVAVAFTIAAFLIFISYPLQTITAIVGIFLIYTLYLLVKEWNK